MADNKKYYYIRLKENFFDSNEIVLLESMQDGYLYSNILLKLYLRSLKDGGKLMFNDRIPYNPQMIATITRHQVGTVEKALRVFQDMGLIEILDNGAIYMLDIQNFIGESSTEADRIRQYRNKIETEKLVEIKSDVQMYDKSTPEIDIDIELEKEIEIKKNKSKQVKHKYGEYKKVLLTDEQYEKLIDEFPDYEKRIANLDEYIQMTGKTYKDHLATIRVWARKERNNTQQKEEKSVFGSLKSMYRKAEETGDDIF